jgi:hypothetical protein
MNRFARGSVATVLGPLAGVTVAFLFSPDPTGRYPLVLVVVLTAAFTPVFYVTTGDTGVARPE